MDLTGPNYPSPLPTEEGSSTVTKREVKGARRIRNACLQCRERKIRCSRTYPCKGCISRGDGDACDWQGGFPSGDVPVHQQRVAQQRQEFDELNDRITQMKRFLSSHLRQETTFKDRIVEWTRIHPEIDNQLQDILYPDFYSTNQQGVVFHPGPETPHWVLPSPCPPDSAASFETCTSSATASSTFRSRGQACSSSSYSPPTAGSFLAHIEIVSPVPFLKPCGTSGYKSWRDLREASPACPTVKASALLNATRLQQHQNIALQELPTLGHFPSLSRYRSVPLVNQQNFRLATAPLELGEPPSMSGFQESDHLYSTPNTWNPFSVVMPEQGFGAPNSFQVDQSLLDGDMVHRTSPRAPFEMTLPPHRITPNLRRATWAGNAQPTAPSFMGPTDSVDVEMLSFDRDCKRSGEELQLGSNGTSQYFSDAVVNWK